MRIVVDLVGHHAISNHVGMVDPRRGFLLPSCIGIAMQSGVSMAGHVPHVSDPRCTRAALGCGSEGQFLLAVIPQVDSEMVCRMPRIASKNILEHRVYCRVTLDVVPLALILPNLQHEHGF